MKQVKILSLLALAQKQAGISELKEISNWARRMIQPVADRFNSKNIKVKYEAKLDKASEKGNLAKLFSEMANKSLIRADIFGYKEAQKQYKILNFQILKLKSQASIDILAYRLGLRVSVIFSYLVCIVSIISVMVMQG